MNRYKHVISFLFTSYRRLALLLAVLLQAVLSRSWSRVPIPYSVLSSLVVALVYITFQQDTHTKRKLEKREGGGVAIVRVTSLEVRKLLQETVLSEPAAMASAKWMSNVQNIFEAGWCPAREEKLFGCFVAQR